MSAATGETVAQSDTFAASSPTVPHEPPTGSELSPGSTGSAGAREGRLGEGAAGLAERATERYIGGREIARGGMGRIVACWDVELGRMVAIKELLWSSPTMLHRFEREVRITATLQHPAIIAVHEAGRWPTGVPFYTMRFVEGRALDQVINDTAGLRERLGLLAHVVAVADALAYAHSQDIVHRDLKPANVLVGDFGETVVIDWGLAKALGDDHGGSVAPAPAGRDGVTILGEAIGTPAYMPPEQARGESVDARGDVYALGALLYHTLAGCIPYADEGCQDVDALLEAVRRGPPSMLADIAPDAPAELVAIVSKAMARNPELRYPSARELADDLKRFTTGQLVGAHRYSTWQLVRRWARRHRSALAVATAMALVLIAFAGFSFRRIAVERDRAESQQEAAEGQRAEVEALLDFMLVELRGELEPIGKLDVLDLVAKRARDYFASRPVDWSRPDDVRARAMAHANFGDVLEVQGDLVSAQREFRASAELLTRLVDLRPGRADWRVELARSHSRQGDVLRSRGAMPAAIAHYRDAKAQCERAAELDPGDPDVAQTLTRSHNELGDVLFAQGDLVAALAEYRAGHVLGERLVSENPDNATYRSGLAATRLRLGEVFLAQQDPARARDQFRKAAQIFVELTKSAPEDVRWQRNLSVAYDLVANSLAAQQEYQAALEQYRAGKQIAERLTLMEPSNTRWQRDLSVSHGKVGDMLVALHEPGLALVEYRRGQAIRLALTRRDPANTRWQRDLSVSHEAIAKALRAQGHYRRALVEVRASEAIAEQLMKADPDNSGWQHDLALTRQLAGTILADMGKRGEAVAAYRLAQQSLEQLVAREPDNDSWGSDLAEVSSKLDAP